ncbi:lipoate--protein ligase family protein [Lignipirellula cremea]|uniref:Octanoyltransferase LipM n=1 Tax=Lignipirellula cremea TaxID=2528010 RepID=A0A518DZM3_9BACT|nr:biotin/lipoate A/B protein ligase family protein [Lignipirellula cremea]QDU97294.1 Octanoyltransferase LipM [Lignipirellula cremea]
MEVRLLIDPPQAGPVNMGIDAALLVSAAQGEATFRLYGWSEPTLSLGYFQHLADRDEHTASRNCRVLRRSTGGGAIVHDRELTYSFAAPASDNRAGASEELYRLFHGTLIQALLQWGAFPVICGADRATSDKPFLCFQRRSEFDVLISGHKIVGSAQRRTRGGLLQHGSILLAQSDNAPELPGVAELASPVSAVDLQEAWLDCLAGEGGFRFVPGELQARERELSAIEAEKQRSADWIERR